MSAGVFKIATVYIASGASTSGDVALGGRPWSQIAVSIGTMSTGVNLGIQNSVNGGSTYYNVFHPTINSATVATPQLFISGAVGSGGGFAILPLGVTLNHIRFIGTGVISGGCSLTVVCSD